MRGLAEHCPAVSRWLRYCGPRAAGKPPPALPLSRRQLAALALAAAALLWLLLTEFEALQLLQLYAAHVLLPARRADPCAPCGCAPAAPPATQLFCARDLAPNSLADAPAAPPQFRERHTAAFDAVAAPRLDTARCVRAAGSLAAAWAAATAGSAAAAAAAGSAAAPPPPPPPPAQPVYASPARRTLIHLYHRPDLSSQPGGDLAPWQASTLASVLATQPRGSFQVVLWSPEAARPCPPALLALARAHAPPGAPPPLTYRVFDPAAEARGTPFAGHFFLALADRQAYADSDIFRLLVLYKYGGLYMDMDVYLFKDLTPLLAFEWATEFSSDGAAGHGVLFNNAVVHFFAGSPAVAALAHTALQRTTPRLRSWAFGPHLLDRVYSSGGGGAPPFRLMPWCFFHGMWSVGDAASPLREVGDEQVVGRGEWAGSSVMRAAWGLHLHGLPRARAPAQGSIVDVYSRRWAAALAEGSSSGSSSSSAGAGQQGQPEPAAAGQAAAA